MNYPSDKLKEQKRKLYYGNRYLIYDVGYGEQGSEMRYTIYRYYLCKGRTEEEAVEDWIKQSQFSKDDIKKISNDWVLCNGRSWLKIVPLVTNSNEDNDPFLKW